jgi:lysophospholipid acyltransferase (LPLAT)-like uncharacterized protein
LVAAFVRGIGLTLRIRLRDDAGYFIGECDCRRIFVFWHNRMFAMPLVYERWFQSRCAAVVLTSASGDGSLLAGVMAQFKIGAVRGSSSRRGAAALLELNDCLNNGRHIVVTPDGPRGPCYRLGPGAIFLAQKSGVPIVPVFVEYSRCVRLKSWDRFIIPLPFSRVDVTLAPLFHTREMDMESARTQLESLMQPKQP